MLGIIIVAVVLLGLYLRSLTPPERVEFFRRVLAALRRARRAASEIPPGCEPFFEMLRQRTPYVLATPAIIGLNVALFVAMIFGKGALSDPRTLIAWGASFGPETTNAEWWRLVTAMFVHSGVVQLTAEVAGLLWMGFVLERLVGPVVFAVTYLAAGVLAGVADLSAHEVAVNVGASGAVFGIYGLFIASMIWGVRPRSPVTIPLGLLKVLAPGAAVFLLYDLIAQGLHSEARLVGFAAGLAGGLLLALRITERKPATRHITTVAAAALVIAVIWAVPLRGLTDVTNEIAQIVATENRTAREYDAVLDRFNDSRATMKERIDLIDRIRPQLQALRARLESIGKVPRDQQPLVANALEYLRTRDESWRLRSEALRKGNVRVLRDADALERVSLNAFRKVVSAAD